VQHRRWVPGKIEAESSSDAGRASRHTRADDCITRREKARSKVIVLLPLSGLQSMCCCIDVVTCRRESSESFCELCAVGGSCFCQAGSHFSGLAMAQSLLFRPNHLLHQLDRSTTRRHAVRGAAAAAASAQAHAPQQQQQQQQQAGTWQRKRRVPVQQSPQPDSHHVTQQNSACSSQDELGRQAAALQVRPHEGLEPAHNPLLMQ
jgi:hypothetical protein